MNPQYDFSGQVTLVTGAAGDLGKAVSDAFLASSATLVLADNRVGRLAQLFPALAAQDAHLLAEGVDVTDPAQVEGLLQRADARFGRIDILVNCVGGYQGGKPLHETSHETFEAMMTLNARSVFTMSRAVLPYMLTQQQGIIVNIAAAPALKGGANNAAYGASKTVVARLTESMAEEYKQQGIRVNAVLPWTIDTPQNRQAMPKADTSRWVTPEAIAQVILFLASSGSEPVNGVLLPVFGRR